VIGYIGYGIDGWVWVFVWVLFFLFGVGDCSDVVFCGWWYFVSVKFGGVFVVVDVVGEWYVVESACGGYVDVILLAELFVGWVIVELWIVSGQVIEVLLCIVGVDECFGVISDVDDIVLVIVLFWLFFVFWNIFVCWEEL